MADYTRTIGDTEGGLQTSLTRDGVAVDLTNATSVSLRLMSRRTGAVQAFTMTISAPASGTCTYDWASGDVGTAGVYDAQYWVTWNDGDLEPFPNQDYLEYEFKAAIPAP